MDKAREQHIEEMRRLEAAIKKTRSNNLKIQYGKALKRMRHELKVYDALKRGEEVGKRAKSKTERV